MSFPPFFGGGFTLGPPPAPFANTVAYWPMDGSLPNIEDRSGRGNMLVRYMQPGVCPVPFLLGANDVGSQNLTGRLSKWGNWKRLLTAPERAYLLAGGGWPFAGMPSLLDAAVFYLLDEASNSPTYADATGRGNTLVKSANATIQVPGPLGTDKGVQLGSAGPSFLILDPATDDVKNGNAVQTISGWANLDALGVLQQAFWGQADTFATQQFGNVLYYFSATDRLQSDFSGGAGPYRNAVVVADSLGPPGTGVWHHMLFQYDPVANVETLYVDGVANVLAEVQRPAPRTSPNRSHFAVPPSFNGTGHSGWDGSIGPDNQCLASHSVNADLAFGPNSKSAWGWLRFNSTVVAQTVMGRLQIAGGGVVVNTDWVIQEAAGLLYFILGDMAGGYDFATVPLADGNWHAFVCWYDAGAGRIKIDLDNGAHTANVAVTHVPAVGAIDFIMGANLRTDFTSGFSTQLLADIGIAGISDGVPSAGDIAKLWAYGKGIFY